jgi:ribose transport system substrate-binding protein
VHRSYVARRGNQYRLTQNRRKLKIGLCATLELPFARAVSESLTSAAAQAGTELVLFDNGRDPETAIRSARALAESRVDIAIEFQRNHQIAPLIGDLFATAGIPLIAIHVPHAGAIYFGPDNYRAGLAAGKALGEYARAMFEGRRNLFILLGIEEAGTLLHARISGVSDALTQLLGPLPAGQTVYVNGSGDRAQSEKITRSVLGDHDVDGGVLIAAASDYSALGALEAVESLRLSQCCAIIGHDGDREAIEKIADPESAFLGTVAFFPEKYGPGLIALAFRLANGDQVPPFDYVTHHLIDKKSLSRSAVREPQFQETK